MRNVNIQLTKRHARCLYDGPEPTIPFEVAERAITSVLCHTNRDKRRNMLRIAFEALKKARVPRRVSPMA